MSPSHPYSHSHLLFSFHSPHTQSQSQQDGEVSPWPQVPGAGDEIGNVLEALLARRERAVDVLVAARGPQRELSTSHEAEVTAVLRREKVMDVVSKKRRQEGGREGGVAREIVTANKQRVSHD